MEIIRRYDSVPTLGSVPFVVGNVIARQQMKKFRKQQRFEARRRLLNYFTRPLFTVRPAPVEDVSNLSYETV